MPGMDSYSKAAMERAMKVQEVILRAMAKKITGWQAAEIQQKSTSKTSEQQNIGSKIGR